MSVATYAKLSVTSITVTAIITSVHHIYREGWELLIPTARRRRGAGRGWRLPARPGGLSAAGLGLRQFRPWLASALRGTRGPGRRHCRVAGTDHCSQWWMECVPGYLLGIRPRLGSTHWRGLDRACRRHYGQPGAARGTPCAELWPGVVGLLVFSFGRLFAPRALAADRRAWLLVLWLMPALSFYGLVHIGNMGYL